MQQTVTTHDEVDALQTALLAVDVAVPIEVIYTWDRERRAQALDWALHNTAVVSSGTGELRAPLAFLEPFLYDPGEPQG